MSTGFQSITAENSVSTAFNTIFTELHTFQLNFHSTYITTNMFRVCLHKLKDKPHYTKPQMQSFFSNQRHFLPQRRSSASVLTSRRKCSDTLGREATLTCGKFAV